MESSAELIESLNGDLSTATGSGEGGGGRGTEERRGGVSESNNASHVACYVHGHTIVTLSYVCYQFFRAFSSFFAPESWRVLLGREVYETVMFFSRLFSLLGRQEV